VRLDTALWRALAVYRLAALVYAAVLFAVDRDTYDRPGLGVGVLAGMALWTAVATWLYSDPRRRRWPLLGTDLALTIGALLSSVLVLSAERIEAGAPTLTVSWAAAPVIAWAIWSGWIGGGLAAAAVGTGAVAERGGASQATVNSLVLLLLLGLVVGYVVQLARRAERTYAEAVQLQAATAERERLSRHVHDGVLQALALVARRAGDPTLAALAGEQEQALRRLVSGRAEVLPQGTSDLRALLPGGSFAEVAAPAAPVLLRADVAAELAAAVGAALDNARRHGGSRAWLLVEDEADAVTVTVRDDGPGIAPGRLEQAERDGRLGVAQSIRGRIADLGGTVCVQSTPGQGTEVELRVPR
jgi:signal transduction histidine kinase